MVFDGVPRRIGQAKFILDYLESLGATNFVTVFIDVAREECIKRLTLRAKHETRVDDTPEGIARRLDQSQELMGPLLEYLKTRTRLVTVDGNVSIPQVTENVEKALEL